VGGPNFEAARGGRGVSTLWVRIELTQPKSVVFFTVFFAPNTSEIMTAFRFFYGNFGLISELQYLLLDTKLDLPGHARHEEDPGHRLPANVI
jgi:hypothetical protein